jgi:hypothetical protein
MKRELKLQTEGKRHWKKGLLGYIKPGLGSLELSGAAITPDDVSVWKVSSTRQIIPMVIQACLNKKTIMSFVIRHIVVVSSAQTL